MILNLVRLRIEQVQADHSSVKRTGRENVTWTYGHGFVETRLPNASIRWESKMRSDGRDDWDHDSVEPSCGE